MSLLALSALFEYICYESIAIINSFTLPARGLTLDVRSRILTTKVDPRAVKVQVIRWSPGSSFSATTPNW